MTTRPTSWPSTDRDSRSHAGAALRRPSAGVSGGPARCNAAAVEPVAARCRERPGAEPLVWNRRVAGDDDVAHDALQQSWIIVLEKLHQSLYARSLDHIHCSSAAVCSLTQPNDQPSLCFFSPPPAARYASMKRRPISRARIASRSGRSSAVPHEAIVDISRFPVLDVQPRRPDRPRDVGALALRVEVSHGREGRRDRVVVGPGLEVRPGTGGLLPAGRLPAPAGPPAGGPRQLAGNRRDGRRRPRAQRHEGRRTVAGGGGGPVGRARLRRAGRGVDADRRRPAAGGAVAVGVAELGDAAWGTGALWREEIYHHYLSEQTQDAFAVDARGDYGMRLPNGGLLMWFGSYSHSLLPGR